MAERSNAVSPGAQRKLHRACSLRSQRILDDPLNNWRRHNEDERTLAARFAAIDPYSSAPSFEGWKESASRLPSPPGFKFFQPIEVSPARTWLLSVGWQRHGAISAFESPGTMKS